jgi:hypothetical protein
MEVLYIIKESIYELGIKQDQEGLFCDNPCGLCIVFWGLSSGMTLHFWGLSSGIPCQKPCLHSNMPFLFRVGIGLSILPETMKLLFYFIFCTSEFGSNLVDSFWFFIFLWIEAYGVIFNWVCCFSWTLFFQSFKLLLILILVDISQWELFYYEMKYRSWRRLIYQYILVILNISNSSKMDNDSLRVKHSEFNVFRRWTCVDYLPLLCWISSL